MTMLEKIRVLCDSERIILGLAIIYTISQISIGLILLPLGLARVLKLQTSVSPKFIALVLDQWRAGGALQIFITHFYIDFFHPVFYGVLLLALMSHLFNEEKVTSRWNKLLVAPLFAAGMDLVENIMYVMFITDKSTITSMTALLSGGASITKWVLSGFSIIVIAVLIVRKTHKQMHMR